MAETKGLYDNNFQPYTDQLIQFVKGELRSKESGEELESDDKINEYIERYGVLAFATIIENIESRNFNTSDANVILDILASVENKSIEDYRLDSFIKLLLDTSPRIRDGAIMGLIEIGRFEGLAPLKEALKIEEDQFIRYLIDKAIARLTYKHASRLGGTVEDRKKLLLRMPKVEEDGYVIPMKFAPGVVNLYEYATLQAIIEQLASILKDSTGPFDGVGARAGIDIRYNPEGDPRSAKITIDVRFDRDLDFYTRPIEDEKPASALTDEDIGKSVTNMETEIF